MKRPGGVQNVARRFRGSICPPMRKGRWKLHLRKHDANPPELRELYDLEADIGETTNVADHHPDVVANLLAEVAKMRADLGDDAVGEPNTNRRPCGRLENARPLTDYNARHPSIEAIYDTTSMAKASWLHGIAFRARPPVGNYSSTLLSGYSMIPSAPCARSVGMISRTTVSSRIASRAT